MAGGSAIFFGGTSRARRLESVARTMKAAAASLALPLTIGTLRRRGNAGAIALAGRRVYLLHGLIVKADPPDEHAGVTFHEIGRVATRNGSRAVLRAAGLSFLCGARRGDFGGG
jgi:predicted Zn-dependent protease